MHRAMSLALPLLPLVGGDYEKLHMHRIGSGRDQCGLEMQQGTPGQRRAKHAPEYHHLAVLQGHYEINKASNIGVSVPAGYTCNPLTLCSLALSSSGWFLFESDIITYIQVDTRHAPQHRVPTSNAFAPSCIASQWLTISRIDSRRASPSSRLSAILPRTTTIFCERSGGPSTPGVLSANSTGGTQRHRYRHFFRNKPGRVPPNPVLNYSTAHAGFYSLSFLDEIPGALALPLFHTVLPLPVSSTIVRRLGSKRWSLAFDAAPRFV